MEPFRPSIQIEMLKRTKRKIRLELGNVTATASRPPTTAEEGIPSSAPRPDRVRASATEGMATMRLNEFEDPFVSQGLASDAVNVKSAIDTLTLGGNSQADVTRSRQASPCARATWFVSRRAASHHE